METRNHQKFWHLLSLMLIGMLLCAKGYASTPTIVKAYFDIYADRKGIIEEGYTASPVESMSAGERQLIPLRIRLAPAWESATITLQPQNFSDYNADTSVVQLNEVVLDARQQAPYTAYIPVTVTGEGWFELKGTLHIQLDQKTAKQWRQSTFDYPLNLGLVSLGGKVYFGLDASDALGVMARRTLQAEDAAFARMEQKRGLLTQEEAGAQYEKITEKYRSLAKEFDGYDSQKKKDRATQRALKKKQTLSREK